MCPNCKQNAPIVYRGTLAYCTACGAPRPPFSAKSVNLAGQPSKIGGSLAKYLGWGVLSLGTFGGLTIMGIVQAIWTAGFLGYALGIPIILFSLVVGLAMILGGKRLRSSGEETQRLAQFEAIYSMALTRGGAVTANDVGRSLQMTTEQADALLTAMSKAHSDYVSIEVDDAGNLFYKLAGVEQKDAQFGAKYRVEADGRVRIHDDLAAGRQAQAEAEAHAEWERKLKG